MFIVSKRLGLILCVTVFCALSALAAVLICPQCGYENAEGAQVCVHCQAPLPAQTVAVADPVTNTTPVQNFAPSFKSTWYLPPDIVEKEIKLAMDNIRTGDVVVARLLFKNAMALDRITDPTVETNRADKIRQHIEKCDEAVCNVTGKCPQCKGTGNRIMTTINLSGEAVYQNLVGKSCLMCKGTGRVQKVATQDEMKPELGVGAKRYSMIQQARKYTSIGNAWIPMYLEDKLSLRQVALLKGASAPPCDNCLGFCFVACKDCKGIGRIKCPKCDNGFVKVNADDKSKKKAIGSDNAMQQCRDCMGTGIISCDTCTGCGKVMCTRCNGTGERPACKTCDGKGLVQCNKCNGTGKIKDAACPVCHGEGLILCPACNGECKRL
jgi:hypothetical protein